MRPSCAPGPARKRWSRPRGRASPTSCAASASRSMPRAPPALDFEGDSAAAWSLALLCPEEGFLARSRPAAPGHLRLSPAARRRRPDR
jgi:hypothetical protein